MNALCRGPTHTLHRHGDRRCVGAASMRSLRSANADRRPARRRRGLPEDWWNLPRGGGLSPREPQQHHGTLSSAGPRVLPWPVDERATLQRQRRHLSAESEVWTLSVGRTRQGLRLWGDLLYSRHVTLYFIRHGNYVY